MIYVYVTSPAVIPACKYFTGLLFLEPHEIDLSIETKRFP